MRLSLINKVIAPFLLVVFTITSCNVFVMPEPDTVTVPIGKGDIRFVYLDEDYRPTINDIGKMAMYVENNELTKDVLVLAEIRNDNIDNDIVVRVMNKQNDSLVSFFYYSGQYFPHKVAVTIDGETITGRFSLYNPLTETYSVEFNDEDGESEDFENFILNKNVFSLHKKDAALTDTQNVRIQHIITTLALWNSLAFQMDDNFQVGGRGIKWPKLSTVLTVAFSVVAVVAVAAVVILAPPASIAIVGATIVVPITTTSQAVVAGIAIAATAGAIITHILADEIDKTEEESQKQPPPNENRRPTIEITMNGEGIENNGMPPYYLDKRESLTFNLKIKDKRNYTANEIIDINNLKGWVDPFYEICIKEGGHQYNAFYFDVNVNGDINDILHIVVNRNNSNGQSEDGRVQLVIKFRQNVIINGKSDGIDFWTCLPEPEKRIRKDIFVLNLTVEVPAKESEDGDK